MTDTSMMPRAESETTLEHATVKAITPAGLIIHGSFGVASARKAAGCLLEPEVGDRVLASYTGAESYILMVLKRAHGTPARLDVSGELEIGADLLSLSGRAETRINGAERLHLSGQKVATVGDVAEFSARRVSVAGEEGHAVFRDARLSSRKVEVVAERVAQVAQQVIRRVEEVETLSIGNLVQRVRENWLVRSKRTSVTASGDMHIDGERIHMG